MTDDLLGALTYTVEVDVTDRSRHADDSYVTTTYTVEVLAHTENDATLTAILMASRRAPDGMPLAHRVTDVVA